MSRDSIRTPFLTEEVTHPSCGRFFFSCYLRGFCFPFVPAFQTMKGEIRLWSLSAVHCAKCLVLLSTWEGCKQNGERSLDRTCPVPKLGSALRNTQRIK